MEDIVSVIVPIYNVEKYLGTCINSIINQTYKNLDIILINDGSTYRCGLICDQFVKNDQRIRVIHQINRGLSEARNIGISICIGSYILFVDGDDYIEQNTIECLLKTCDEYDAEITCCGHFKEYVGKSVPYPLTERQKQYEGNAIIISAMKGNVFRHYAWNKLWRKSLFDETCLFPQGRLFEDIATTWKILRKAKRVVCVPEMLFHHTCRKDSIGNVKTMKNLTDRWIAFKERYDEMSSVSEGLREICIKGCLETIGYTWRWLHIICKEDRIKYQKPLNEMRTFLRSHYRNKDLCSFATRISLFCAYHTTSLSIFGCYYLNQFYRKINDRDKMME